MTAVFPQLFPRGPRLIDGTSLTNYLLNPTRSTEDSITAHAGGTQAAAYQLRAAISRVTTVASAADSVVLPPSYVGATFTVTNAAATNAMQLFGTSPDTIDGVATGTGISVPAGTSVTVTCTTQGAWRSVVSNVLTSGAQTISGAKTFSTMPIIPTATVAATGTNQGNAAAITTGFTLVTAADGTVGVLLPAAAAGLQCIIKNADAANNILKIWPNTGDAINAITADSSFSIAAKTSVILIAFDATTWYSIPLLPS